MPVLSVITINYNNKIGLEKTIRSVIDQTFRDFEFIVIDGGSIDGSDDLITRFKDKITYSVSEKDSGIYNAQNKGIKVSKGDYLLFLNSGDFLCSNTVLGQIFSKPIDSDIIYGDMRINWGGGNITEGKMPELITKEHMFKDTLWHPVSFIKRNLFDKYGLYDESYQMVADYKFFFKTIINHKVSCKHVDVLVTEYNTDGLSSDPHKKKIEQEERKRVLKSYLSEQEIQILEKSTGKGKKWLSKLFGK